ncbi:addiction module HigA family antidote [Ochrobactrum anthropi]|nr:addiction module HigA family antidote [Brucella anthropi]PQZ24473.1 addiction module antidote protein, HigA family [Ochrobactrum vermis]
MVRSYKDARTKAVAGSKAPKGFPADLIRTTVRKITVIDSALILDDLRSPPGNRLEALNGDRKGQRSIHINDQWRICFVWTDAGAEQIEIVDYHWKEEAMTSILPPVHPGEILREEYLIPLGMSAGALARNLNVPRTRIERLATEQTAVTPDTALRLAKFFRTTPEFWMNMQSSYDLKTEAVAIQDQLLAIHELKAA